MDMLVPENMWGTLMSSDSGISYELEPGVAIEVDPRDIVALTKLGFVKAPDPVVVIAAPAPAVDAEAEAKLAAEKAAADKAAADKAAEDAAAAKAAADAAAKPAA